MDAESLLSLWRRTLVLSLCLLAMMQLTGPGPGTGLARAAGLRYEIPAGVKLEELRVVTKVQPGIEVATWGASFFRILEDGSLAVADTYAGYIKVFDRAGKLRKALGQPGHSLCDQIGDFCVTPDGDFVYLEKSRLLLVRMDPMGSVEKVFSPLSGIVLADPVLVEALTDGRIVVGEETAGRIRVFDRDLRPTGEAPWTPLGLAAGSEGRIFVLAQEAGGYRIAWYDKALKLHKEGLIKAGLDVPINLESVTPGGELLVSTPVKGKDQTVLSFVSLAGEVVKKALGPRLKSPRGVRVAPGGEVMVMLLPDGTESRPMVVVTSLGP